MTTRTIEIQVEYVTGLSDHDTIDYIKRYMLKDSGDWDGGCCETNYIYLKSFKVLK
jgi:hypothetical protein